MKMENNLRRNDRRNHRKKARKPPKVPIKTYRWEDIRRARRRGGYPWTYLYKGPYTEKIDPEQFTMDALRRAKSSSPMGRRSNRIEISEVSSWADYSGKTTPTLLQELIDEPNENVSAKNSRPSSVVIEEYLDDKDLEDDVQIKEFQMESAESSTDNISQYLDKDDRGPMPSKSTDRDRRAKSEEETGPRERKLSAESSFSLTKLGVLKKLQSAKSKIKVPKLSFPTKKFTKSRTSPPKEDKPKKSLETTRLKKVAKPEYIYIPLKPPAGKSDEFSHLEFEVKNEKIPETKSDNRAQETIVEENNIKIEEPKEAQTNTEENNKTEQDTEKKSPFSTLERGPRVTKKPPIKINPAFKKFLQDVRELKDKEEPTVKHEDVNEEPPLDLEEQQTPESESPKEDFDKLFEASTSRSDLAPSPSRNVRSKSAEPQQKRRSSMDSSYSRKSLSKLAIMKKLKSASDKIKSALSLDNFKKKIGKKEVKPEVKVEKPEVKVEDEHKKPKVTVKSGHHLDMKPKKIEPVYIHIPLKPPEGETDEFSYLESGEGATKSDEPASEVEPIDKRNDSIDSSGSPQPGGVQFIFLTPPSDDEILDKDTEEVPETPSSASEDNMFNFCSLKKLAEDAVDRVSPESKRKGLDTVSEESDKGSTNEDVSKDGDDKKETEAIEKVVEDAKPVEDIENESEVSEADKKIIVDVEDGLSEALRQEERLKSALKTAESGSGPKRVSFKRKSKTPKDKDKDNGYEIIEVPKEETIVKDKPQVEEKPLEEEKSLDLPEKLAIDLDKSMSVDEEKSYLDEKIVKDVSLEEDYNKWSTGVGDHEYEPINPPNDDITNLTMPSITVVDQDSDPKLVISAMDILDKPPVEEKKRSFFQFGRGDREKSQDRGDSTGTKSSSSQSKEVPVEIDEPQKSNDGPNKFQVAFKQGTDKVKSKTNELRNKIHSMKRPSLPKAPEFKKPHFKKPDFKRFKIQKPNLHLPKLPDTATFHLPNISLPGTRRTTSTKTIETRQFSTESNVDDSEQQTKRHKFDLTFGGTFPRFRKPKKTQEVVFATVPRPKNGKQSTTISSESSTRIPLHSEDSMDPSEHLDLEEATEAPRRGYEDREPPVDMARLPNQRFSGDVVLEEEYERENQAINRADYLSRWQHGNFKERNGDNQDEKIVGQLVEQRFGKTGYKDYSDQEPETLEARLRKDEEIPHYIEDTEEEEFDLRLTQQNRHMVTDLDNLEDENNRGGYSSEGSGCVPRKGRLGKLDVDSDEFFVVHEIREGFQNPANALAQMNEYDPIGSNRSLPMQMQERPEPIKAERKSIKKPKRKKTPHVSREEIPVDEESVEEIIAPSRPRRKSKRNKKKQEEKIVPYQETIPLEIDVPHGERLEFPRESLGILGDDEREEFENERIQGKEQPDLTITHPYKELQVAEQSFRERENWPSAKPSAPPRKHRSLRSLTSSVNDSILMEDRLDLEDQIIPSHQMLPKRPSRRSRSNTSSLSRASLPPSQRDTDSIFTDEGYMAENQQIPSYLIENQSYKEQYQGILDRQPCIEEPCTQDIRDCMGYAIVDKSKQRDPPLPPPRTPPRRRKRETEKFATVPRHMGLNQSQAPPVRPLRNYSTLSHIRSSRNGSLYANEEDKENHQIDIGQYIEMEDDTNRDLVSGEIVQKMRQRPLPAPPRPPRKTKTTRKSLQDITSKENIIPSTSEHKQPEEETVSTQTEPLPSDFVCEEIRQEPSDTIITPRVQTESPIERFEIYDPRRSAKPQIRREIITPTMYSFEETVTHGTLLVQPIDGSKVVPDHQLSREHLVPITKEFSDEDETSEIPESFKQLRNPEEQTLKADKLQVSNIDVDSLTVNQLLASKLVVSEIDAAKITTNEIQGKSGTLKLSDIELPPQLLEQLVRQINIQEDVKKKTPIDETVPIEEPTVDLEHEISPEPPIPPPRGCTLDESTPDAPPRSLRRKSKQDSPRLEDPETSSVPNPLRTEMLEPDVDDQPPPRPPQPLEGLYLPSQPPASFYALRAKQYVDENIPTAPRRKRHHSGRSRPVSRSHSTSDDSSTVHRPPSRLPRRASEPSISELSGRLAQACGSRINNSLKRLIYHLTENLLRNADGNQDLHVFMIILLVLIAGLILLGYGEGRTVVHLHHWEYFNPPKDL
ncbi:unnamed protein product [Ceutorhynchus assimilis]|uniref:Titin n=1 Tax=Ceutorhynchus assimilis TaxID=467358 RepID=A0A9N9MT63_9CUCU|nr:unnamed protein product [Ceutorhynchus assimilis]